MTCAGYTHETHTSIARKLKTLFGGVAKSLL